MLIPLLIICVQDHPTLTKGERKKICGLMDVKKLSMDVSMLAAQNERLSLRVVVQVLYFEQVRAAAGVQALNNNPSDVCRSTITNTYEEWDKTTDANEDCYSLKKHTSQINIKSEDCLKNDKLTKTSSKTSKSLIQLFPSRSRRIFDKLWVVGKGQSENRSSETSGSSQSPASLAPGDTKSSISSARRGRYSIS